MELPSFIISECPESANGLCYHNRQYWKISLGLISYWVLQNLIRSLWPFNSYEQKGGEGHLPFRVHLNSSTINHRGNIEARRPKTKNDNLNIVVLNLMHQWIWNIGFDEAPSPSDVWITFKGSDCHWPDRRVAW